MKPRTPSAATTKTTPVSGIAIGAVFPVRRGFELLAGLIRYTRARVPTRVGVHPPPTAIDDTADVPTRLCRIYAEIQSAATTQMTWPVFTGWPAATESSLTRPARCACTSFSIFIASTMHSTWPASTS